MNNDREHENALVLRKALNVVPAEWEDGFDENYPEAEYHDHNYSPVAKYATCLNIVKELKKLGYVLVEEKEFKDEYYEAYQDGYSAGYHEGLNEQEYEQYINRKDGE